MHHTSAKENKESLLLFLLDAVTWKCPLRDRRQEGLVLAGLCGTNAFVKLELMIDCHSQILDLYHRHDLFTFCVYVTILSLQVS